MHLKPSFEHESVRSHLKTIPERKNSSVSMNVAGTRSRAGFTLLELLVVVGILAALVALALPFYQDYVNQSKITAAQSDMQTFKKALAAYDQLEPTPFTGTDLRTIIGRYLQDYRKLTGQINPIDPWGSEYLIRTDDGVILSPGPNRIADTAAGTLVAAVDDLLETWKPPFTVASARAINATTVDVVFTRKLSATPAANFISSITNAAAGASTAVTKISDTIFRFTVPALTTSQSHVMTTLTNVNAMDGKIGLHTTKPDGTAGNTFTFTY